MAIKAVVLDQSGTHHLIIGLSRDNIESLLDGDVFTLPRRNLAGINNESDVVLFFAETNEDLRLRLPPVLRPV